MNREDKKTILLVEDEAITATMEKQQLEEKGYSVHHVTTGEDAVQTINENILSVDLILMDIDLGSGIDGTQAAEEILKVKDIPVVFLSSHTEPEVVEKTEKITSYGYVVKNSGIFVLDASIKMAFKLFDSKVKEKRKEEALRQTEAIKNKMVSNIGDVIVIIDLNGINQYKSPNIEKLFGWKPEELVGENTWNNIHPDDLEAGQSFFGRILTEPNATGTTEMRYKRRDGNYVWIEISVINLLQDKDIQGILGNYHDITGRKKAEEALLASKEQLETLSDNIPGGVVYQLIVDPRGNRRLAYVSSVVKQLHGVTQAEALNNAQIIYDQVLEDDMQKLIEVEKQAFATLKPFSCEVRIRKPDGEIRWLQLQSTISKKPDGSIVADGIEIDITGRKLVEEEIQKQLTEKETLLREVHHRVKNNIANIEGLLSLQTKSTSNPEVKAALQDSISRVQSMRILYNKLLLSKDIREVSMKSYIEDLIDSLHDVFAGKDNIIIEKHISDFSIISKQAITIGIIINELLTNVFKYAFKDRDKGKVSISIDKKENTVTIIIQDNGIGIDERILENKSPGFGLTIIKMLVEQLKGTCSLMNENGTRSVIQFEL